MVSSDAVTTPSVLDESWISEEDKGIKFSGNGGIFRVDMIFGSEQ